MTDEEKKILLKDLTARLSYGVKAKVNGHNNPITIYSIEKLAKSTWAWRKGTWIASFWNDTKTLENIKPYLRPMESMTEEEKVEYQYITERWMYDADYSIADSIDWLNAHHFDYRGLIPKGLALESEEGMYK